MPTLRPYTSAATGHPRTSTAIGRTLLCVSEDRGAFGEYIDVQSASACNALGVQAVVNSVRLYGDRIPCKWVRLGEVARGGAEHGELLGCGRHGVWYVLCCVVVLLFRRMLKVE